MENSDGFPSVERREARRFPIVVPVKYRAFRRHLLVGAGTGQSINLASRGVLFRAESQLETGLFIELSIEWPVIDEIWERLRLRALGRVVRIEGDQAAVQLTRRAFKREASKNARIQARSMLLRPTRLSPSYAAPTSLATERGKPS
jgi:PilZ domain-containing protein